MALRVIRGFGGFMKNQLQERMDNETESGKMGSLRDSMGSKYTNTHYLLTFARRSYFGAL